MADKKHDAKDNEKQAPKAAAQPIQGKARQGLGVMAHDGLDNSDLRMMLNLATAQAKKKD